MYKEAAPGWGAASFLLTLLLSLTVGCRQEPSWNQLKGVAQGTTWELKYLETRNGRSSTDSLSSVIEAYLITIDELFSTYRKDSYISQLNASSDQFGPMPELFMELTREARELSNETNGLFNPAVSPLLDFWGFGRNRHEVRQDTLRPEFLLVLRQQGPIEKWTDHPLYAAWTQARLSADLQAWEIANDSILKHRPGVEFNFNAIAPGFTLDGLADILSKAAIENYYLELGGEIICKGLNPTGQTWTIGIEDPLQKEGESGAWLRKVQVHNRALATSGNYRNNWQYRGHQIGHSIDPIRGIPVSGNLLSVSVMAPKATRADAWATAIMSLGSEYPEQHFVLPADLGILLLYKEGEETRFRTLGSWNNVGP